MIDIIILANSLYKEVERTINSILYQYMDNKKYNIIIMNYGTKDYKDTISYFSKVIKLKELKINKKLDVCLAKQYALDKTNGEYVIFFNAGDVFSNPFGLELLYENIYKEKLDAVFSSYIREFDGKYKTIYEDKLFSYGKIYKRSFIKKNNICFINSDINNSLCFNRLFLLKSNKIKFLKESAYMVFEKNTINFNINYEVDCTKNYLNETMFIINNYMTNSNYDNSIVGELSLTALYYAYINYLINKDFLKIGKKKLKKLIDIYDEHKLQKSKETIVKKSCIDNPVILDYIIDANLTFENFIYEAVV